MWREISLRFAAPFFKDPVKAASLSTSTPRGSTPSIATAGFARSCHDAPPEATAALARALLAER